MVQLPHGSPAAAVSGNGGPVTEPHGSGESGEWARQYSTSRSMRAVAIAMQMSDAPLPAAWVLIMEYDEPMRVIPPRPVGVRDPAVTACSRDRLYH